MDCSAERINERLVVENALIRREFEWNGGALISRLLLDKANDHRWELSSEHPDCVFPGEDGDPKDGTLQICEIPGTTSRPEHLCAEVVYMVNDLEVKRRMRIYPDCAAIASDYFLKGRASGSWMRNEASEADRVNVENINLLRGDKLIAPAIDRLALNRRHLQFECVEFFDITDYHNNLVYPRHVTPYRFPLPLRGNVLLGRDPLANAGFFVVKEAPCSDIQVAHPGCDFVVGAKEALVLGVGADPRDLDQDRWIRCYGSVVGVSGGSEEAVLTALRTYQEQLRISKGRRDHMIMLNTWGDRSMDRSISETFSFDELEAGKRLGITHFQLDDGWQSGTPGKVTLPDGDEPDPCWIPHPDRFPNGLAPVVKRAKELEIELCVWFVPRKQDGREGVECDFRTLMDLHRQHGIRTFKFDGGSIADKQADLITRELLERVSEATRGEAVFNLDVTAGRRWGYHYLNSFGNLFLENRYTDWSNYYPHWALRNLWQLARYVPPQYLQMEFLNNRRNEDKYPADDPLAPSKVPFEYCFATTMASQPLAWFEAQFLPPEAFEAAPLLSTYLEHQERLHAGRIFPIGEEPSGFSWTGFQSSSGDNGYFIVYRELNDRESAKLRLFGMAGKNVTCKLVTGAGADFAGRVDDDGRLTFSQPGRFSFSVYRFEVS